MSSRSCHEYSRIQLLGNYLLRTLVGRRGNYTQNQIRGKTKNKRKGIIKIRLS